MAQIKATTTYTLQLTEDELQLVTQAIQCFNDGNMEVELDANELHTLEHLNRLLRIED